MLISPFDISFAPRPRTLSRTPVHNLVASGERNESTKRKKGEHSRHSSDTRHFRSRMRFRIEITTATLLVKKHGPACSGVSFGICWIPLLPLLRLRVRAPRPGVVVVFTIRGCIGRRRRRHEERSGDGGSVHEGRRGAGGGEGEGKRRKKRSDARGEGGLREIEREREREKIEEREGERERKREEDAA